MPEPELDTLSALDAFNKALTLYSNALQIYQEKGDRTAEATLRLKIGDTLSRKSILESAAEPVSISKSVPPPPSVKPALEAYQAALSIYQDQGDRLSEALTLAKLGDVYFARGKAIAR